MNSDSVWNLSLALIQKGFLKTAPIDDYNVNVRAACAAYQHTQGWSGSGADGIAGPLTAKQLGLVWMNS